MPIVLGGAQCDGSEEKLSSCQGFEFGGVAATCRHNADVFLRCSDEITNGSLLIMLSTV